MGKKVGNIFIFSGWVAWFLAAALAGGGIPNGQVRPPAGGKPSGESAQVARPESAKKLPSADRGAASLIFFYFGDSVATTLAQETMELFRAMRDYDFKVLLKHELVAGKYVVSQTALNMADVVDEPTTANLKTYLRRLAADGYLIDLWIFSHGLKRENDGGFRTWKAGSQPHDEFGIDDIRETLEGSDFKLLPIRMVYQCNCYGQSLNAAWREVGAKASLGARDVNFYPIEFSRFANQWHQGKSFIEARDWADKNCPKAIVQNYIRDIDAPREKTKGTWPGCPFGFNVLGMSDEAKQCGRVYFKEVWKNPPWQGDGISTMNYCAWKIVVGEYEITKNTKPVWK